MLAQTVESTISLDAPTLFVVATCITALLGLFLLFAYTQDKIRALAWWGAAYLVGGLAVAMWSFDSFVSQYLPVGIPNALMFIACGMMWSAARLFHGRPVLWVAMGAGALTWLLACDFDTFVQSSYLRILLSAVIIASYTFLTALELWRERRKALIRRWPAIFVPLMHGAVLLFPIPLAAILPEDRGIVSLASGWIAVFAIETLLYAVGTAFVVLVLAKEQTVRIHKTAAATDSLTGVFNRRAFLEGAQQLIASQAKRKEPVSVLLFDLDHFKSINDRFGHMLGDEVLRVFAQTATATLRVNDHFGRLGGEEFSLIMAGSPEDAATVAERVRFAFEICACVVAGQDVAASVSVGVATARDACAVESLLTRADVALYRAKAAGRNRVIIAEDANDVVAPPLAPLPSMAATMAFSIDPPKPAPRLRLAQAA